MTRRVTEAEASQLARESRYGCHPEHGCIWTADETTDENILRNREYFAHGIIGLADFERRLEVIFREAAEWPEWQTRRKTAA